LRKHLRTVHRLTQQIEKQGIITRPQDEITEVLIDYVIKDLRPISTVEGTGFVALCQALNPDYRLPCRQTLTKRISDRMDPTMNHLKEAVKGTSVAITTDIWSSDSKEAYLDISIHWINDKFILNHAVADFILMRGSHTKEAISHEIRTVINEWKFNISAIVTDNGANMTGVYN